MATFVDRLDVNASLPPPESFEEVKKSADLIGLVRIEEVVETAQIPVNARVVEVFNGRPAPSTVSVVWPRGRELYLEPKVGDVFYVFLKKNAEGAFVQFSVWWTVHRVRERTQKEVRGRRIHHSDSYWELNPESAVRYPYTRKPSVSKWPVEHVVESGDSMWKLADRYYGDRTRWRRIMEHNPWIKDQEKLQPGWKISIPSINDYE
jgi:nucleoid-associated protein YgaU